ncbi:MAG: tetratricopeptide repeat protein [Bacteroidota bacterium]
MIGLLSTLALSGKTSPTLDSLLAVLVPIDSSADVEQLNKWSWEFKFSDPSLALELSEKATRYATTFSDLFGLAESFLNRSVIFSIKGEYDRSDAFARKAIPLFQQLDHAKGIAKSRNVLGVNCTNRGDYDQAIEELDQAFRLFEALADTISMLKVQSNLGNIQLYKGNLQAALAAYEELIAFAKLQRDTTSWTTNLGNKALVLAELGDHPKTLATYLEALNLAQQIGNRSTEAINHQNIGLLLNRHDLLDEARYHLLRSFDIYEELGNETALGRLQNNLGINYFRAKDYDKALEYYQAALKIYEAQNISARGNVHNNIGSVYNKQKKYDEAVVELKKAIEIDSAIGKPTGLVIHYKRLGHIFLNKERYPEAEFYLLKAYNMGVEMDVIRNYSEAAGHLSNVYEALENYEQALHFQSIYTETQDSIYGRSQQTKLTRVLVNQLMEREETPLVTSKTTTTGWPKRMWLLWTAIFALAGLCILQVIRYRRNQEALKIGLETERINLKQKNKEVRDLEDTLYQKSLDMAFLFLSKIQKDEFFHQFTQSLKVYLETYGHNSDLQKLINQLHVHEVEQTDWDQFKTAFEQIHPQFFDQLLKRYPKITNKELRHAALIRLNIAPKETAQILGISIGGVHKARYRLRQQFQLERSRGLEQFLASIG